MAGTRRVLVTGGCGFIGANLLRYVRARTPWSCRVIDDMRAGSSSYLEPGLAEVVVGDAADPALLAEALDGVDAVVHLASQTGVVPSLEDPVRDFEGNTLTTFRVLEGCRQRGVNRVVFASSGAAVGEVDPPIHESVVPRPVSPYGAGKLAGEAYCQGYAASFGIEAVALRFSNVYGPYSQHKRNAVPIFIKRCLENVPLDIYGDGTQTRDFVHVDDLCAGILKSLTTDGIGGEVFQLGTGVETSIVDLAELVKELTVATVDVRFHPRRAGEVYRSRVDITKAARMLGYEATVSLAEGLTRTAEWYKLHPAD